MSIWIYEWITSRPFREDSMQYLLFLDTLNTQYRSFTNLLAIGHVYNIHFTFSNELLNSLLEVTPLLSHWQIGYSLNVKMAMELTVDIKLFCFFSRQGFYILGGFC